MDNPPVSDSRPVSIQDSFPRRFYAYLKERFPPLGHGILIISYCSSNQFLAHRLTHPGEPMAYTVRSLISALAMLCMFFHLRVFDEHKDYEDDCRYYPNRILQRGLISLRHLKIAGGIAIAMELMIGILLGPAVLVSIMAALLFSILMLKEFFVRKWLKSHFLIYATSHMLIMPLFAMVIYSVSTGRYLWEAPSLYWLYAFVGFFVTFNWEVSRKIRAPEDEIEGVDSYTRIFGTYGAAYIVLLIRVVDTAMVSFVGWRLGLSGLFYAVLVALFCVCMMGFLQFRFHTNTRTAKHMETYAGMYIIAFDLTLAVEIVRIYGLELPW